jgi:hypothetical protein
VDKLLGQSGENIDWSDIEDLGLAVFLVNVVQKWYPGLKCLVTDELRRMTPTRIVR